MAAQHQDVVLAHMKVLGVKTERQEECAFSITENHLSWCGVGFNHDAGTYVPCSDRVDPHGSQESERRPVTHCQAVSETAGSDGSCVQRDTYWPAVHETPTVVAQDQGVLPEGKPASHDQGHVAVPTCLRHVETTKEVCGRTPCTGWRTRFFCGPRANSSHWEQFTSLGISMWEQTSCRGRGRGPGNGCFTQVVKQIWRVFGQAQVDLFATRETSQCPLWYCLTHPVPLGLDAMVQTWPRLHLYAFPPIALLPGVLERVRRDGVRLLLLAPFWLGRVWFSDLISLLDGSAWEIPVRRDLLSQTRGTLVHPRPKLWRLWVWPLRGHSS